MLHIFALLVCLVGSVCGGGEGDTSDYPTAASVCMPKVKRSLIG